MTIGFWHVPIKTFFFSFDNSFNNVNKKIFTFRRCVEKYKHTFVNLYNVCDYRCFSS